MKLILLRHGESIWNKENRFTGWTDVDLSSKGVEEAINAGKIMKNNNITFDVAFSSVLLRAKRTLDLVLKEMNVNVDNDGAITTRVVKKLKKEGYVKKLGKTIKKYKISLTEKGHMLSKEILSAFNKAKKVHLGKLTQEDFVTLSMLADKLQ